MGKSKNHYLFWARLQAHYGSPEEKSGSGLHPTASRPEEKSGLFLSGLRSHEQAARRKKLRPSVLKNRSA